MAKFLNLIKAMGFGSASSAAVQVGVSTDTQPRLQIDAGGKHTWGAGGSSSGDTTLYRSATNTLKTDGNIDVNDGSVFTTSIDGSTSLWNNVTLYTDNGIVQVYGSLNATGEFVATGKSTFNDAITIESVRERFQSNSVSSNVITLNYDEGSILYQPINITANFTLNVTNVPTDNAYMTTVSVFVEQGSTGYRPSTLQIAGVTQTIKWAGGTAPTPTSSSGKIDLFTFTLIRRNNAWTVLGNANLNY